MELKYGKILVKIARTAIEHHVKGMGYYPEDYPSMFADDGGVFTTLHTYPGNGLRGCIGYPEPVMPLIEALLESAKAVTEDPRFPPLAEGELEKVTVEVSVLTPPKIIDVRKSEDYLKKVRIGRDGLMIEKGPFRGLLLPQVPVELKWDAREFLDNLSMKAGMPPESWKEHGVRIHSFRSEIFREAKPGGKIRKA